MLRFNKKNKYRISKLLARHDIENQRRESITNNVTNHLNQIQNSNDDINVTQQQINYQYQQLQLHQQQYQQQIDHQHQLLQQHQQHQHQFLQPIINQRNTSSYNPTFNNFLISSENLNLPKIGKSIKIWDDNSENIPIDEDGEKDEEEGVDKEEEEEEGNEVEEEENEVEEEDEEEEIINNSSMDVDSNEENDETPGPIEHPNEIIEKIIRKLNVDADMEQKLKHDKGRKILFRANGIGNDVLVDLWENHRVKGEDRRHFCERFANNSIFKNSSADILTNKLNSLSRGGKISLMEPGKLDASQIFGITSLNDITKSIIKDFDGEKFAPFKNIFSDIETDVVSRLFNPDNYQVKSFSEEFENIGFFKFRNKSSLQALIQLVKKKQHEANAAGATEVINFERSSPKYDDLIIRDEILEKLNINIANITPSKAGSKYEEWELKIINHVFLKEKSKEYQHSSTAICKALSLEGIFKHRTAKSIEKHKRNASQPNKVKTYEWKELLDNETIKKETGLDLLQIKASPRGSKFTNEEVKIGKYIIENFKSLKTNEIGKIIAGNSIFKNRTVISSVSLLHISQPISHLSSESNSNDTQAMTEMKTAMRDLGISKIIIPKAGSPYSDNEELILKKLFENSIKSTSIISEFVNKFSNVGVWENRSERALTDKIHTLRAKNELKLPDDIKVTDYFNVTDINSISMEDVLQYQFEKFARPTGDYKKAEIELIIYLWDLFLADPEEFSSKSIVKKDFADLLNSNGFFRDRTGLYTKILTLGLNDPILRTNQEFNLDQTMLMNLINEKVDLNNFSYKPGNSDFSFKQQFVLELVLSFATNDITSKTIANFICSSELKNKIFKNRRVGTISQNIQRIREHNLNEIFNVEQIENISIQMVNNLNSTQYKPRGLSSNYSYNEMKLFISLYNHKDESMSINTFLNALAGKGFFKNRDYNSLRNLMRKLIKDKDIEVVIDF
ncbi:uncharacterized protein KGF55_002492 [Candida pseudojiufengensis]|uniref:uncharacterized protein n=1 Tax=Candida pseudojiufengensis TaxID=497109 RepID=UPI0022242FB9|nr:uncharacterized protein KGF55_002492 [Candida pseudojiufengensis]KAI5963612.1 hypothetical protein KGF55_002492 [Candida pseudojiufengensis]